MVITKTLWKYTSPDQCLHEKNCHNPSSQEVHDLWKLYIEVETSVKDLRTLNVDTSTYGSLLVPWTKNYLQIYD